MSDRPTTRPHIEARARELAREKGYDWAKLEEGPYPPVREPNRQYFRALAQAQHGRAIVQAMLDGGSKSKTPN